MKRIQYTIRDVPPSLDRTLRHRARKEGKSLNAALLDSLNEALGKPAQTHENRDLDFLVGSWVEDPDFNRAVAEFERLDEELWR